MDIGIDLGTTYSVLAVKGQVELTAGYPPPRYLPECDVTIIPAPDGNDTFPSVFWSDPDNPDDILIGAEAKQKGDDGEGVIMFSKRAIGTDKLLQWHDRSYTAKEVATHTLRYLKSCAERALGQRVQRAVVTHPAYFDPNQIQETRDAAQAAGFEITEPEQLLMEPAAATLAYAFDNPKDPLRVMCYDLGGGTFDVTILERRNRVMEQIGFDGNKLLGGFNFDRELVQWIVSQLAKNERHLPYDERSPKHRATNSRLLLVAEKAKYKLSEARGDKAMVEIKVPGVIDDNGETFDIRERINRKQYAELIKPYLVETIERCENALVKAKITADQLDLILLVGGSTYGPWIGEAIEAAFKTEVEPAFYPDLCVAAGAALVAANLPPVVDGSGLQLVLQVPATSVLPTINIAGQVRARDGGPLDASLAAELKVRLNTPEQGQFLVPRLDPDDGFLFEDVELTDGDPTEFKLEIEDSAGWVRLKDTRTVLFDIDEESSSDTDLKPTLAKPIYLRVADGMKLLAEEGAKLPVQRVETVIRLHDESELGIDIFMAETLVGRIVVEDIPEDAGRDAPVEITVEITKRNQLRTHAKVKSRTGTVVAERKAPFRMPPIKVKSLPELQAEFTALRHKSEELQALSEDGELRATLAGRGNRLMRNLNKLFAEQAPERQEIQRDLEELDRLVAPPVEDMSPPRSEFQKLLKACREILKLAKDMPQAGSFEPLLDRLENEGNEAYKVKNHKNWGIANENLGRLYGRIRDLIKDIIDTTLPETSVQKDARLQEISRMRADLRDELDKLPQNPQANPALIKARAALINDLLAQMEKAVKEVPDDLKPEQGQGKLVVIMRPKEEGERSIRRLYVEVEVRE